MSKRMMSEPTRRLKDPIPQEDGSLVVHSVTTPTSFKVRGEAYVGSRKVIPVIFVPGTMGTNLRVRKDVPLPPGYPLKPGDAAWQPPNGSVSALKYARQWGRRKPWERQLILNPDYVEVDDTGPLDIGSCSLEPSVMRERGWGEIFTGSYGTLLFDLQSHLNMTFRLDALNQRQIRQPWKDVMQAMQGDPTHRWGVRSVEPLTESELEKYAQYQYPLYACGYNWLQSCGESAKRLEKRITDTITWWQKRHHECNKVILITHSMGGLVGRACAKRIPDKILGIVHGVMPALGAPLAYRRLACGTECDNPANGSYDNYVAGKFADIAGPRPEDTTPVLSVAPGALELLPNQLYPRPWLHVRVVRNAGPGPHESTFDYLHLPDESEPNPYKLYRNMDVWYRLVSPTLADPAGLYSDPKRTGGVTHQIMKAIGVAEKFHYWLADYYHPATFAYYGNDKEHPSYGQIRWVAQAPPVSTGVAMTPANIRDARFMVHEPDGARTVEVEGKFVMTFAVEPQESMGDDTVPHQSASGPSGKIKQLFATRGYKHQESYQKFDTLLLTRYCIVKLAQEIEKNGPSK
jgi:pimeloyl-ACP methyl ester carboxylesterase